MQATQQNLVLSPTEVKRFVGRGDTYDQALDRALEEAGKVAKMARLKDPVISFGVQRVSDTSQKDRTVTQVEIWARFW